jgi:PAP2 superfamily
LPPSLITTHIQTELAQKLQSLWQTGTKNSIGLDFYIAFPSMHIAQPLIVLWFLRSMKTVVRSLLAYDFLMIFSTVLLQWHYLVDLIGGALVAIIAIKLHQLQTRKTSGSILEKESTPAIV